MNLHKWEFFPGSPDIFRLGLPVCPHWTLGGKGSLMLNFGSLLNLMFVGLLLMSWVYLMVTIYFGV